MDGTDGAKFATLQRAAEMDIESVFETTRDPNTASVYVCVSVVVYEKSVPCVCVGELWGLLFGIGEH